MPSAAPSSPLEAWLAPARQAKLKPAYLLLGDNLFLQARFRRAFLDRVLPEPLRPLGSFDCDLEREPLDEILSRARNRSLMSPAQVFLVRNVAELFTRGGAAADAAEGGTSQPKRGSRKHGDFPQNLAGYLALPSPDTHLLLIADHLHLTADPRRIGFEDKNKLERIEQVFEGLCPIVYCRPFTQEDTMQVLAELTRERNLQIEPAAAELLLELVDYDLSQLETELEKLALLAGGRQADSVMVLASSAALRQRALPDLLPPWARRDRRRLLEVLNMIWLDQGEAAAIPLVYQLSRALKQALLARQYRVFDRGTLYRVLPPGLKPPLFLADAIVDISRNWSEGLMCHALIRLQHMDAELRSSPVSSRWLFESLIFDISQAVKS